MADIVINDFEPLFYRLAEDYEIDDSRYDEGLYYINVLTNLVRDIPKAEGRYAVIDMTNMAVGDFDYAYLKDCRDLLSFATTYPRDLLSDTGVDQMIREFLQLIVKSVDIRIECLALDIEDYECSIDLPEVEYPRWKSAGTRAREIISCPATYFLTEFEAYMAGRDL